MQVHEDGTLVVSATDLVGFLECDHLVTLELERARGERDRPFRDDPELELLQRRGYEHEQRFLDRLRADGRRVHEIATRDARTLDELRTAQAETLEAMRRGEDVIFQATFFDGRWRGHADFLLRRDDRQSALGAWSYDVADTKLARRVRAAAILQMCVYADLLERAQGTPPETVSVVTGDGTAHPHRLADYAAYYRAARQRFEARVFASGATAAPALDTARPSRSPGSADTVSASSRVSPATPGAASAAGSSDARSSTAGSRPGPVPEPDATYPEPVEHCRVCPWWTTCVDRRRADDHLSLVANAGRSHRRALVEAGVTTLERLATLDRDAHVRGVPPRILERLASQAGLQLDHRRTGRLSYELLSPEPELPGRGLAALPAPSALDVFFDIEADPWAEDGGLEYLLGWAEVVDDTPAYHPLWAHDRAGEKAAFESFVDLVLDRLDRDPRMHVYHYGGYESGALKRLMQRHATREDEVDRLLRGRTLVNLYDHVLRGALRASVESYSIKQIERFCMPEREGGITRAGFSVVEYERWLETRDPSILDAIAAYNRDDCLANLGVRDWFEQLRVEAAPLYPGGTVGRPERVDGAPPEDLARTQAETRAREDALRAGLPVDRLRRTNAEQARWLLAAILDWHRREAKPQWWDHFRLSGAPMDEIVADASALGDLQPVEEVGRSARSVIHRYRFDPEQETRLREGDAPIDPATDRGAGTIVRLDPLAGIVDLRHGAGTPHPRALIPARPYGPEPMRSALGRLADHVIDHGIEGPGPWRAARDMLLRLAPRLRGHRDGDPEADAGPPAAGWLAAAGEPPAAAARRLVTRLDGTVLPIQGPPGTGKTHTGARMILDLVSAGRRVGVTAQSHRVIANLLEATVRAADAEGVPVRVGQRCDDAEDASTEPRIVRLGSNDEARRELAGRSLDVVGGTSWLWAREDMDGSVHVLVVDEAGQVALATACAVSGAADSLVLLGDPNQLPQVSQGTHPEGAGSSALEHLVGDARTIAPDRGLLLSTTYRLHPDLNAYVSEVFYEGRLTVDPPNARQALEDGWPLGGTGVRHVPLVHHGSGNRSRDEARWIAEAIAALAGRRWTDRDGVSRALGVADILVVAPYNAQVAEIARTVEARIGQRPEVGTVDRFQGREAPIAIYSMTTSTPEDAPRDFEFLYSGNRLNVAISRAQGLAVLIASPALLRVACRTPAQMRLVNALCRLVEHASVRQDGPPGAGARGAPDGPIAGWRVSDPGEAPGADAPVEAGRVARTGRETPAEPGHALVLFPELEGSDEPPAGANQPRGSPNTRDGR